jgi:hypothetical protein
MVGQALDVAINVVLEEMVGRASSFFSTSSDLSSTSRQGGVYAFTTDDKFGTSLTSKFRAISMEVMQKEM